MCVSGCQKKPYMYYDWIRTLDELLQVGVAVEDAVCLRTLGGCECAAALGALQGARAPEGTQHNHITLQGSDDGHV